ncbi:MAG: hypothetical protein ACP5HS_09875 [Anaerolineae bacterium]
MGILPGDRSTMASPIQEHQALVANDLQWVDGMLETLGNPHNYINQDDAAFLTIKGARIAPWVFTGLPQSKAPEFVLAREKIQFMILPGEDAQEQFREAPRTQTLIVNLPLAVVRGNAPFLSEAQLHNFLDFWKGLFFPLTHVQIHYLSPSTMELPSRAELVYVNQGLVQSYLPG